MVKVPDLINVIPPTSKEVPYFTPEQPAPAGSAYGEPSSYKLFSPLKLRGLELPNRVGVSPMDTYSSDDGKATPWHLVHYGQYALRGPAFTILESTGISDVGRITSYDLGIYTEEQKKQLKKIADFFHSQGKLVGPQLGHAGDKASTVPLYYTVYDIPMKKDRGGYWEERRTTSNLTVDGIHEIVAEFKQAAKSAIVDCGFDFVEIHGAHGYLLDQFLSPLANKRTDSYGGSFENRTRFLFEVLEAVTSLRKEIGKDFPLFLRISASDNTEDNPDSWRLEDSVKLAPLLVKAGVDLIDVSSGGIARGTRRFTHQELAKKVKETVGDSCFVSSVGFIREAKVAEQLLQDGVCDIVLSGRGFLRTPAVVEDWADDLGVKIQRSAQEGWPSGTVWEPIPESELETYNIARNGK